MVKADNKLRSWEAVRTFRDRDTTGNWVTVGMGIVISHTQKREREREISGLENCKSL
jgi:hypothetical protein